MSEQLQEETVAQATETSAPEVSQPSGQQPVVAETSTPATGADASSLTGVESQKPKNQEQAEEAGKTWTPPPKEEWERLNRRWNGAESAYQKASRLAKERDRELSEIRQQHQRAQQELEGIRKQQSLPVYHKDHENHGSLRQKMAVYEAMEKMYSGITDPAVREAVESQAAKLFSAQDIQAISEMRAKAQETARALASGDFSAIQEHFRSEAEKVFQEKAESAAKQAYYENLWNANAPVLTKYSEAAMSLVKERGYPLESVVDIIQLHERNLALEAEVQKLRQFSGQAQQQRQAQQAEAEVSRGKPVAKQTDTQAVEAEMNRLCKERGIGRGDPRRYDVLAEVERKFKIIP